MNNFIIISRTYTETTPESAEVGDFSDTGYIDERQEVTFRELVKLMKEHNDPSQSPTNGNIHTWFSSHSYTSDYRTGTERAESIHYHRDNTPNAEKYWRYAYNAANKKP
jgi:hypothetical protein